MKRVSILVLFVLVLVVVASFIGEFTDYYPFYADAARSWFDLLAWEAFYAAQFFALEFFFRGFLLFALYRCCGPIALFLQAVPFAMAHIGKPELETLSCIFGGAAFGYVAWRTDSAFYPFLIHWFQAVLVKLVASGAFG